MPIPLFDAQTHRYTSPDGKPLISVTQALKAAGLIDDQWFSEDATWRGSIVHKLCELNDMGTLSEDSVDPAAAGYLAGWRIFRANNNIAFTASEQPLYHASLMYAGTPDRAGCGNLIDIKTGQPQKWHALQLAAYAHLFAAPQAFHRIGVYLDSDGGYKVVEYWNQDLSRDFAVFCSALNIANWKG